MGGERVPKMLVGDFGEGHVEGSGQVGTGTIEVVSLMFVLTVVYCTGTYYSLCLFEMG